MCSSVPSSNNVTAKPGLLSNRRGQIVLRVFFFLRGGLHLPGHQTGGGGGGGPGKSWGGAKSLTSPGVAGSAQSERSPKFVKRQLNGH